MPNIKPPRNLTQVLCQRLQRKMLRASAKWSLPAMVSWSRPRTSLAWTCYWVSMQPSACPFLCQMALQPAAAAVRLGQQDALAGDERLAQT
jgi:hypothetical protein